MTARDLFAEDGGDEAPIGPPPWPWLVAAPGLECPVAPGSLCHHEPENVETAARALNAISDLFGAPDAWTSEMVRDLYRSQGEPLFWSLTSGRIG